MSNVEPCRRCGRFFESHTGKRVAAVDGKGSHRRGWYCDSCVVTVRAARKHKRPTPALLEPDWDREGHR